MRRFLLTNGLGGYSSLAIDFSAQADTDGVFVAAPETPEHKVNMVRRLEEVLTPEEPFALQHFSVDPTPCWIYKAGDVLLQRQLVLGVNENTCALLYRVENTGKNPCTFTLRPVLGFGAIPDDTLYIKAGVPAYRYAAHQESDGYTCADYTLTVAPGQTEYMHLVFSCTPTEKTAQDIFDARHARKKQLLAACPFRSPLARYLYMAADDFIVTRACDGVKTLVTGYPKSTGEDVLMAFAGCLLATNRLKDAGEILENCRDRSDALYKTCLEQYHARQAAIPCTGRECPDDLEDRLTENCLGQLSFGDCYAHAATVANALMQCI